MALSYRQQESYAKAETEGIAHLRELGTEIRVQHVLELITRLKQICKEEKWLRKSEQGDKWNRCLIEGMIVLSETGARDEQTTPP